MSEVLLHTTAAPPDLGAGYHPSSHPHRSHQLKFLLVMMNIIIFTAPAKKFQVFSMKKHFLLKMTL